MKRALLILSLLAAPVQAQEPKETRTFDGCNWTTCVGNLCSSTLLHCEADPLLVLGPPYPSTPNLPVLAHEQEQESEPGPTLFDWLKTHTTIISGVALADGEQAEVLSLSVDVDWEVAPKLRGFAGLALFSRQRVQGDTEADIALPTSLTDLALYSAGRGVLGAYYELAPRVAAECRGGLSFEMSGILGKRGDPVDGSRFLAACGIRLSGEVGHLSILGGHSGPVVSGEDLWSFIPSLVLSGEFTLTKSTSFILDVSAGRDRITKASVTTSLFAVRSRF